MNFSEIEKIFKDCEIINDRIVIHSNLYKTLKFIKDNYHFDMLKEIVAIDNMNNNLELQYRLYSICDEENLTVSITIDINSEVESVSSLYDSAIADEKEIYDLYGTKFSGNSELKRLYMPESWEGHPLRKDYEMKDERLKWND